VTRLGDRMGAGTLRDCVRVTGEYLFYTILRSPVRD
jgi:hypothetical protein